MPESLGEDEQNVHPFIDRFFHEYQNDHGIVEKSNDDDATTAPTDVFGQLSEKITASCLVSR